MAIPTPDPATVDTVVNVGGGGLVGALAVLAQQWAKERRRPGSKEDTVDELRKELSTVKQQIADLTTSVALSTKQGNDNEKGMSELRGEFHAMAASVQLTMNQVQSHLAGIEGYMRATAEMRAGRQASRVGDLTP